MQRGGPGRVPLNHDERPDAPDETMTRNRGFLVICLLILAPAAWLLATTSWGDDTRGMGLALGSLVTVSLLLRAMLAAHRLGRLLPNRCGHCDGVVSRIEVTPAAADEGAALQSQWRWRCGGCGRLH